MKHKPTFIKSGDYIIYSKVEVNDDFFFRKTRSISINAKALEKCTHVRINLSHRDVIVFATKKEIKEYKDVKTFHGEVKYYYPIEKWEIIDGLEDWASYM